MPKRTIDAFVFDLDGTLLHTLPDLIAVTNESLRHFGMPEHDDAAIQSFAANGAVALMLQAVPNNCSPELAQEALAYWKATALDHGALLSRPFPGVVETLERLHEAGKKLGVLSNKFQAGVDDQLAHNLPDLFDVALGDGSVPRKPDPTGMLETARRLGVAPERMAYVGDSVGDMQAAVRAGALAVGVTWGYHPVEQIEAAGADMLFDSPEQLLTLI